MTRYLLSAVLLSLSISILGCATPGDDELIRVEEELTLSRTLGSPAYFTIRRTSPYAFEVDIAGNPTEMMLCPGATVATYTCSVSRLSLAGTGLSLARQTNVINAVATNGGESTSRVVMAGTIVSVRDRRGGTTSSYTEFRATAVYLAPSVRSHVSQYALAFVREGEQYTGSTRTIILPIRSDFEYELAPDQPVPTGMLSDHIVTGTLLGYGEDAAQILVDQIFRHVTG
jgi:hypothetical protein